MIYIRNIDCRFNFDFFYRHLHQKDPHEWTLERLAESFPIDTYGVKKVLRSKLPRNAERMRQLDQQVISYNSYTAIK